MVTMLWPRPLRLLTIPLRPLFGPFASSAVGPRNAWHGKPSSRWAVLRASSSGKPTRGGRRSWGSSMRWGYPWRIWSLRLTGNAAAAHAEPQPRGVGRGTLGGGGSSRDGTALPRSFTRPLARSIRSAAAGGPGLRTQPLSRPAGGGCGGDAVAGRAASPRLIVHTAALTNGHTRPGGTADTSNEGWHRVAPSRPSAELRTVRELQPRARQDMRRFD